MKLTVGNLLLALNYDTHERKCFTLTERCQIHQQMWDRCELSETLAQKVTEVLQDIRNERYQLVVCHYVEITATGERVLIREDYT